MNRERIIATLRSNAVDLKRLGASTLFVFGSVARDEAGPLSDVDLFFDFEDARFSLVELVALRRRIGELVQAPVDVMSRGSIHPRLRAAIESSAVQVF